MTQVWDGHKRYLKPPICKSPKRGDITTVEHYQQYPTFILHKSLHIFLLPPPIQIAIRIDLVRDILILFCSLGTNAIFVNQFVGNFRNCILF